MDSGLRCLIINDPSSPLISISLTAGGGSFQDPPNIPGVAHLCEHVVMLAKGKSSLRHAVAASGGSMNAFTSTDQTTFAVEFSSYSKDYLNNAPFALDSLLPAFAALLAKPKFDSSNVAREIAAVHEEHLLNIPQPQRILWHGLRLLASPSHPFSRFGTGDRFSLSAPPAKLKAHLKQYFTDTFCPNNMALVIKGPQSTNHLRKSVFTSFQGLTGKTQRRPPSNVDLFADSPLNLLGIITKGVPRIRITYATRIGSQSVPQSVLRILCNLIGDESCGTLCYYLKRVKQYAESISVFTQRVSSDDYVFIIDVEATGVGMKNLPSLLSTIFHFMDNTIPLCPDENLQNVANEYALLDRYCFDSLKPNKSFLDEVTAYSENLQDNVQETLLVRGAQCCNKAVTAADIKWCLKHFFLRENARVQLLDADLRGLKLLCQYSPPLDTDPYYKFQYAQVLLSYTELSSEGDYQVDLPRPLHSLLIAIPDLLKVEADVVSATYRDLDIQEIPPSLWLERKQLQVWNHEVTHVSSCNVTVNISFDELEPDARSLVGIELICSIVGDRMNHILYNTGFFNCVWGIYANPNGRPSIMIDVAGRQPIIISVLQTILQGLVSCCKNIGSCRYEEFKRGRVLLRRRFEKYANARGLLRVNVAAYKLMECGLIDEQTRIETLELLDTSLLEDVGACLTESSARASVLASGATSDSFLEQVESLLQNVVVKSERMTLPNYSTFLAPRGGQFYLSLPSPSDDKSAVVLYFIQIGVRLAIANYSKAKFVQKIMTATAIENLREKRGLGYGIFVGMKMFRTTFGIQITVSQGHYSCDYVTQHIEGYLSDLESLIGRLSDERLNDMKSELLEEIQNPSEEVLPSSLFANLSPIHGSDDQTKSFLSKAHWSNMDQILGGTFNFGAQDCEEAICQQDIEDLTKSELVKFFDSYFSIESKKRTVVVIAKDASQSLLEDKLTNVSRHLVIALAEAGLAIRQSDLMVYLRACTDHQSFLDLDLTDYFTAHGRAMRYQKFKLRMKLGSWIHKLGAKHVPRTTAMAQKEVFHSIEELQAKFVPSSYCDADLS